MMEVSNVAVAVAAVQAYNHHLRHHHHSGDDESYVDKALSPMRPARTPSCVSEAAPPQEIHSTNNVNRDYHHHDRRDEIRHVHHDEKRARHLSWGGFDEKSNSQLSLFDDEFHVREAHTHRDSWTSREAVHDALFDDSSLFDVDELERRYGDNQDEDDDDDKDEDDDDDGGEEGNEDDDDVEDRSDGGAAQSCSSSSKTHSSPNNPRKIYALRLGRLTRACMYFSWNRFREQIDGFPSAEFAIFDDMEAASQYILESDEPNNNNPNYTNTTIEYQVVTIHNRHPTSTTEDTTQEHQECTTTQDEESFQSALVTSSSSACMVDPPTHEEQEVPNNTAQQLLIAHNAMWIGMFSKLKEFYDKNGHTKVQENENPNLKAWIKDQRIEYRKQKEGKESDLNANKMCLLKSIDFQFQNRGKYVSWKAHFEAYKLFQEKHGMDCSPPPNTPMARWVYSVRKNYRSFQEGECNHNLTPERIQMLDEIGFEWVRPKNAKPYVSDEKALEGESSKASRKSLKWMAMYEELKMYKQQNGTADVPSRQGSLGRWAMTQRKYYKMNRDHANEAFIDNEKVKMLSDIGFTFNWKESQKKKEKVVVSLPEVTPDDKWQEMFDQLCYFRNENGHCNVPMRINSRLRKWIISQRKEFLKTVAGEQCALSPDRIQRLRSLGFSFEIKSVLTWDQRFTQLMKFKEEHGHVRVPRQHQGLGKWIAEQRLKYRLYMQGQSTNLTSDQIKRLNDVGMVWQILRISPENRRAIRKPWNIRFQELVAYKEQFGHTKVPQSFPYLGNWVHQQRTHYKLMQQGRKSLMTPARAKKLQEIGFMFEVKPRKSINGFMSTCSDESRSGTPMTVEDGQ